VTRVNWDRPGSRKEPGFFVGGAEERLPRLGVARGDVLVLAMTGVRVVACFGD